MPRSRYNLPGLGSKALIQIPAHRKTGGFRMISYTSFLFQDTHSHIQTLTHTHTQPQHRTVVIWGPGQLWRLPHSHKIFKGQSLESQEPRGCYHVERFPSQSQTPMRREGMHVPSACALGAPYSRAPGSGVSCEVAPAAWLS